MTKNTPLTGNRTLLIPQLLSSNGDGLDGILFELHQAPAPAFGQTLPDAEDLSSSVLHWATLPNTQKLALGHNCFMRESWIAKMSDEARHAIDAAGIHVVHDSAVAHAGDESAEGSPLQILWAAQRWYLKPVAGNHQNKAARKATIRALQLVLEEAEPQLIEDAIKRDASLTFNTLRLANSAAAGLSRPVSSVSEAIALVGRSPLKRWLNLMVFYSNPFDKRREMLLAHAAFRAFAMEHIVVHATGQKAEGELAFLAGMTSMMGVSFGINVNEVLDEMGASAALRSVVLDHTGSAGAILLGMESVATGVFGPLVSALATAGMDAGHWNSILSEGGNWALDMTHVVRSA